MTDLQTQGRNTFQDSLAANYVSVQVRTSAPRRTTTVPEVADLMRDSQNANVKGVVSLMPEQLNSETRSVATLLKKRIGDLGWVANQRGNQTQYLVPVSDLTEVYAAASTAREELNNIVANATADWDSFREECLSDAGTLKIPPTAFPYATAESYRELFSINLETSALVAGDMTGHLPQGVAQSIIDDIAQQNQSFYDEVLYSVREELSRECKEVSEKLGTDMRITRRTFAALDSCVRRGHKIIQGHCQIVDRVCTKLGADLPSIMDLPGTFSSSSPSFNQAYTQQYQGMLKSMAQALDDVIGSV